MPCMSLTSCSLVVSVVGELGSAGAGPGLLGLCFPITRWSGGGTPAGHAGGQAPLGCSLGSLWRNQRAVAVGKCVMLMF